MDGLVGPSRIVASSQQSPRMPSPVDNRSGGSESSSQDRHSSNTGSMSTRAIPSMAAPQLLTDALARHREQRGAKSKTPSEAGAPSNSSDNSRTKRHAPSNHPDDSPNTNISYHAKSYSPSTTHRQETKSDNQVVSLPPIENKAKPKIVLQSRRETKGEMKSVSLSPDSPTAQSHVTPPRQELAPANEKENNPSLSRAPNAHRLSFWGRIASLFCCGMSVTSDEMAVASTTRQRTKNTTQTIPSPPLIVAPATPKIDVSSIITQVSAPNEKPHGESNKLGLPQPQTLNKSSSMVAIFKKPSNGGSMVQKNAAVEKMPLLKPLIADDFGKKCLVLDLDETLVHSSFKMVSPADFIVPVEIENEVHNVYVLKRPGVDAFMKRMGELFEVVVFTASLAKYADPVLDLLDKHRVVRHRLFREACVNHKGNYVKDLSMLGRDLRHIIIIDNSPASYLFHPANAVPCTTWFNDVNDTELLDLIPFLEDLRHVEDVTQILDNSR